MYMAWKQVSCLGSRQGRWWWPFRKVLNQICVCCPYDSVSCCWLSQVHLVFVEDSKMPQEDKTLETDKGMAPRRRGCAQIESIQISFATTLVLLVPRQPCKHLQVIQVLRVIHGFGGLSGSFRQEAKNHFCKEERCPRIANESNKYHVHMKYSKEI